MTKTQMMQNLAQLYRVGNASDSENRKDWTKPEMAGNAMCAGLDRILRELVSCGVLSAEEQQEFYDTL